MTADQIAEVLGKARRQRGEPDVDRDELLQFINEAKKVVQDGHLDADEKRALGEFRKRELERSINEPPFWIKAVWGMIFGGIVFWIFK